MSSKDILLVDSSCALCNKSVGFIMRHGGENKYQFISLYSDRGKDYLEKNGFPSDYSDSVVLLNNKGAFIKTDALLLIAKSLKGLYPLLYAFKIVPKAIRDSVYNIVAKHRNKVLN